MTTIINAVASTGLTQTADGSGIIKVQSNGVTTNALAWINYNGSAGTIRSSYNVASVTKNGSGDYTINFTNALSDANYCGVIVWGNGSTKDWGVTTVPGAATTTTFRVFSSNSSTGAGLDEAVINVAVFGN